MVLMQRKLYFPRDPEGEGPTFSRGGGNFFQGGPNAIFL